MKMDVRDHKRDSISKKEIIRIFFQDRTAVFILVFLKFGSLNTIDKLDINVKMCINYM